MTKVKRQANSHVNKEVEYPVRRYIIVKFTNHSEPHKINHHGCVDRDSASKEEIRGELIIWQTTHHPGTKYTCKRLRR